MIYLIPSFLADNAIETIPPYVVEAVKKCNVIFAENNRTARRFLKKMDPSIVIDDYQWFEIQKNEEGLVTDLKGCIAEEGKTIAVISEAGCPGVADPGQMLVAAAQKLGQPVKPLVGPSSILLALMASGMNGQQFCFHGYLPIEHMQRKRKIQLLEEESRKNNATQIFIETPYRNDAMLQDLLEQCKPDTMICVAVDLTAVSESVKTFSVRDWRQAAKPELHKRPSIFLLYAGA